MGTFLLQSKMWHIKNMLQNMFFLSIQADSPFDTVRVWKDIVLEESPVDTFQTDPQTK